MKARIAILIIGAIVVQLSPSLADPKNEVAPVIEITDRDFVIASLLHRIYEASVQAEEVEEKVANNGGARTPHDDLPVADLKASIKKLEGLADVPSLRAKLSTDLEEIKRSALGPRHPHRRWLELLSRSLEKYGEPIK